MAGMYEYNHAGAKIKAMKAGLLQQEDYEHLIRMPSVQEAALYLKSSTCYREALKDLQEDNIHRGHLEILLYRSMAEDADKISHYVSGYEKELFYHIYTDREIEDIKKMLRFLRLGRPLAEMDTETLFRDQRSQVDFEKCLAAKTEAELIEGLKATIYYPPLKALLSEKGTLPIFDTEMTLDYYGNMEIIRRIQNFKMQAAEGLAMKMFGSLFDYRNILYVYRGRRYYNLPKEILYRYLVPLYYRISKQEIRGMIEAASLEDAVRIADQSFYGRIFDLRRKGRGLAFQRFMRKEWLHLMNAHPFGLASILGYLLLKEIEIRDITVIIEGIRYSVISSMDLTKEIAFPLSRKEGESSGH